MDSKVSCKCTCTWLVDEKDNAGASGRHPGEREDGVASRIEEAVRLSPTGKANCDLYPEYLVHSILRPKITLQRRTQRRQAFCVATESEGKKASSRTTTQNTAEREGGAPPTRQGPPSPLSPCRRQSLWPAVRATARAAAVQPAGSVPVWLRPDPWPWGLDPPPLWPDRWSVLLGGTTATLRATAAMTQRGGRI